MALRKECWNCGHVEYVPADRWWSTCSKCGERHGAAFLKEYMGKQAGPLVPPPDDLPRRRDDAT